VAVTSKMIKAKLRLMPYIYAQAIKATETGIPFMRPMILEFPDDPTGAYLDKQYMFGDNILVAPVLHADKAQFYIPSGIWTDFFTGETTTGPQWVTKTDYPLDALPVYVRPGTVLLLGPEDVTIPDYEYGKVELEARCYQLQDGQVVEVAVPTGKGKEMAGTVRVGSKGVIEAGRLHVSLRT
jgi:alpha-glucosidase (family GH31 glycosyl hydrolase)